MSTTTASVAPYNSTDTQYRTWGGAISAALSALGWVQTADTGQINWTTVLKPDAGSQSRGYEIWRMNDSLQATLPVFLKIEYGSGSSGATYPGIWITVGTGTDGAGNLTGRVSTRTLLSGTQNASAYPCYFSGNSSRLVFCLWATLGNGVVFVSIERSHSTTGSDTADGVLVLLACGTTTATSQFLPAAGTVPSAYAHWNAAVPPSGTGAMGTDTYVYPVRSWMPGETCASLNTFLYFGADLTSMNSVSATAWDGNTRTILPIGGMTATNMYYGGNAALAMRYD